MMFAEEAIFEDLSILCEEGNSNIMGKYDCGGLVEINEQVVKLQGVKRNKLNDGAAGSCSSESKKSVHRDIERQRRQEMAALYASLRSLLPLEYVKGKRAASDHMEQAVNYINNTQKKIEEMKMKRNKLKKKLVDDSCVKVNLLRDEAAAGMEILITTNEPRFPLSNVLAYLLGLGLNVTTSVSTRAYQYSLHKLHIELNEVTSIDISKLEQSLVDLI